MNKNDIVYIILHYNSIEDTLRCIDSLSNVG